MASAPRSRALSAIGLFLLRDRLSVGLTRRRHGRRARGVLFALSLFCEFVGDVVKRFRDRIDNLLWRQIGHYVIPQAARPRHSR